MIGVQVLVDRAVDRLLGLPTPVSERIRVGRDLRTPMADGIELLADLYRPAGFGPRPVVLMRTPYGKHQAVSSLIGRMLARQGFGVFVQNVRGTFGSGGEFDAFHQERADGLATADWVRRQRWCDGRLAAVGPSYLGYTQWAFAPYLDPPLAAMCPSVTASEIISLFYPGGALALHNMVTWSSLIGTQESKRFGGLVGAPSRSDVRAAMAHLPVGTADVAAIGKPERFLRDMSAHDRDDFWTPTDHSDAVAAMRTPTSMVTGWWDLFLPMQLRDFAALAAAGRDVRITIGPWGHDVGAAPTMLRDQVFWLRRHLLGDGAQPRRAPVRLFLQNAREWLEFDSWPPPSVTPTRLYADSRFALSWAEPSNVDHERFVYDATDPTPSVGGPLLPPADSLRYQRDNREIEWRHDVLVYTSPVLPDDLDVVGPVSAAVYVRTDTADADVFVRLCDVDPRGVSRNVTDGIVRLRPTDATKSADDVVRADVELHPTGYRFRRGHRLRVQIAGGAFPRFARNHGTGEPVATAVGSRPIQFEIHSGPTYPTSLTLPVLVSGFVAP